MYHCNRCGKSTLAECRAIHAAEESARTERAAKMVEIRSALEAMSDEEFRAFNRRAMLS